MEDHPLRVLIVERDPEVSELLQHGLTRNSFEVFAVPNVEKAREALLLKGFSAFGVILVSRSAQSEAELEFLDWIRDEEDSLSTLVLLGEHERGSLSEYVHAGVVDYLDKPVVLSQVRVAVSRALERTRERRALLESRHQVEWIGSVHHQLIGVGQTASLPQVTFCYHPKHGVGGDFANIYPLPFERYLIVSGDVSGHDLRAAFVSAYFQGIARGMIERGGSVPEIFSFFNQFLVQEWKGGASGVTMSLSACALVVDLREEMAEVYSCGFPLPLYVSTTGKIVSWTRSESPLGWFEELDLEGETIRCQEGGALYLWSDGVEDMASRIGVSPFAVAYRMMLSEESEAEIRAAATDDLMLVKFRLRDEVPEHGRWRPFLFGSLGGDQVNRIDEFQEEWARSLRFALPSLQEEKCYDVLLSVREAVLNGMIHGARGVAEKKIEVALLANSDGSWLRARIEDPGEGHTYDLRRPLEEIQSEFHDGHSGLTMLKYLATEISIERSGAVLMLDFKLN